MTAPGNYIPGQYPYGGFGGKLSYLEGGSVSFGEAVEQALRNAFVYRGRASLSAYWWFTLFLWLVVLALDILYFLVAGILGGGSVGPSIALIIFGAVWIFLALVSLALAVRRLHDTDRSGSWLFIGLVPFVGGIILLIFTLQGGTRGPNRFS